MRTRKHVIALYFNEKELAELRKRMQSTGLSFQAYAHKALFDKPIAQRPCEHHGELLSTLSDISNGVGEILRRSQAGEALTEQDTMELHRLISETWHIVSERY